MIAFEQKASWKTPVDLENSLETFMEWKV